MTHETPAPHVPSFGFVIDNGSCIGCHACSTACKSENQVPLGVARTWVKSVEAGVFPDSRRSFQVTRCNHCANPPCVRSCPTSAMYRRPDGIVEFDSDACIGCKACMQACPYDAIYLDPETKTAAKCHYCGHRTDVGLEPACVVVCPEHAIIAGDMNDPTSEISRVLAKNNVTVRKPEQGTAPKLFYIEGNALALHPTAVGAGQSYLFAENHSEQLRDNDLRHGLFEQGMPGGGPIAVGGRMSGHLIQTTYNQQHQIPWHWPIPAYLVTKHVAGGVFALLGASVFTGHFDPAAMVGAGSLAMLMLAVTLGLLVYDLDRPDRFLFLFTRPQWRSWIARAAWLLSAFTAVATAWWGAELAGITFVRPFLAALAIPLGVLSAVYSAFLFAQAEGRDLWQSPHLPFSMAAQAAVLGLGAVAAFPSALAEPAKSAFALALLVGMVVQVVGDAGTPQASELARRAAYDLVWGRWSRWWWGSLALGGVLPLLALVLNLPAIVALALAAAGTFVWAYAFVTGPQEIPNS